MSKFEGIKQQAALNLGIPLPTDDYFGYMSTRDTGSIGGNVTRQLVQIGEELLSQATLVRSGSRSAFHNHQGPFDGEWGGGDEPPERSDEPQQTSGSLGLDGTDVMPEPQQPIDHGPVSQGFGGGGGERRSSNRSYQSSGRGGIRL